MLRLLYSLLITLSMSGCQHNAAAQRGAQQPYLLYLDADGHYYKGDDSLGHFVTRPYYAKPSAYINNYRIQKAIDVIREDYSTFYFDITTDSAVYAATPKNRRIRCVLTDWVKEEFPVGLMGIAVGAAGDTAREVNCFVLVNTIAPLGDDLGNTISHEVGHTLGLNHQSFTALGGKIKMPYNPGNLNWAPIMGYTSNTPMSTWNVGPADDPKTEVNEVKFLERVLGARTDSIPGSFRDAAKLTASGTTSLMNEYDDVDMYVMERGTYCFRVKSLGNSMLNIQVFDHRGKLVNDVDGPKEISVTSKKKFYIRISTKSNSFVPRECMVGQYRIEFK